MHINQALAEVRDIVHEELNAQNFHRIFYLAHKLWLQDRDETTHTFIPYAREHLAHWYALNPIEETFSEDPLEIDATAVWDDHFDPPEPLLYYLLKNLADPPAWLQLIHSVWIFEDNAAYFTPEATTKFASSPHVKHLKRFGITGTGMGEDATRALFRSQGFQSLEYLSVYNEALDSRVLRDLAASKFFPNLIQIDLENTVLKEKDAQILFSSPLLKNLKHLHLESCALGVPGALALASSPHLTQLEGIGLDYNKIGDEGLEALAKSDIFSPIVHLSLTVNGITSPGLEKLARLRPMPHLQRLNLFGNQIGNQGLAAFSNTRRMPSLTHLNLQSNNLGNEGIIALASAPSSQTLRMLDLSANPLHTRAARHLLRSPHTHQLEGLKIGAFINNSSTPPTAPLPEKPTQKRNLRYLSYQASEPDQDFLQDILLHPQLEHLNLPNACDETDPIHTTTIKTLHNPALSNLKRLSIEGANITQDSLIALFGNPYLKNLTHLDLEYVNILAEAWEAFAEAPFLHNLRHLYISGIEDSQACSRALQSPELQNLQTLRVSNSLHNEDHLAAMLENLPSSNLQTLILRSQPVRNSAIKALLKRHLHKLEYLTLSDENLSDLDLEPFFEENKRTPLHNLKKLTLDYGTLQPETVHKFSESQLFPSLTTLELDQCPMTLDDVEKLVEESSGIPNLEHLYFASEEMEEEEYKKISIQLTRRRIRLQTQKKT